MICTIDLYIATCNGANKMYESVLTNVRIQSEKIDDFSTII